ncbi:hypothetical protein JRG66_13000 [Salinimicrobium tongyeongense]|uniref:Uncharacterized protein n=1 Tax=Salinimicrobium tongyeongense TaxID=2809707 RepID=A0ABY6NQQ4_9FLAO|nr:hypothetical protein [Salinimicrobium tongyeongense]UZH54873.1 hypothetical protein JRG66_13000 [Salinimicrobium tongyeongense]
MAFLGKKDEEKILLEIRGLIESKLTNGFTDRRGRPVVDVEAVNIIEWEIDEDKSNRDEFIVKTLYSQPRVWVSNDDSGGKSNENFQLKNTKPIKFVFNEEHQEYKIENEEEINFINTAPY